MDLTGSTVHETALLEYCRLCGSCKAIPTGQKNPVSKYRFAKDIKASLNIDISLDNQSIHPPSICESCRLKLKRWRKKLNLHKTKCVNGIAIFEFVSHTDSCKLCTNSELKSDGYFKGCAAANGFSVKESDVQYVFYKISPSSEKFSHRILVEKSTKQWRLYVHDIDVTYHLKFKELPRELDRPSAEILFSTLAHLTICSGNPEYEELNREKSVNCPAIYFSNDGSSVTAYEETKFNFQGTIRHRKCAILIESGEKCLTCETYKGDLSSMLVKCKKKANEKISFKSRTPNVKLSQKQVREKLKNLSNEKKVLKRKFECVEKKLFEKFESEGCDVNRNMDMSLREIITGERKFSEFPDGSPQQLLWQQQVKYLSGKTSKQMRWHPTVIKWCIAIYAKSSKAYDTIRNSGFLNLPHMSTLRDYTSFTKAKSGFNLDLIERIKIDVEFDKLQKFQKNVSVLFDEVKVKQGLVYSSETGQLIGFTDLGEINAEIETLLNSCVDSGKPEKAEHNRPLATHVIAFMVRGIFTSLHQVFGYFPCTGFNSHQLFFSVWRAVGILQASGFHVRTLICDGAAPNRKFFRLHRHFNQDQDSLCYYAMNPFSKGYRIYFISDPPHLMKTTRNNWENSGWNNKTRHLEFDGQQIKWSQLVSLVEGDTVGQHGQPGQLRMLPKMTNAHLRLTPSLRMKVKLATQVLSSSVARAFELVDRLRPTTRSTRKFVSYMDTFFDCLNVTQLDLNTRKRKPTLAAYSSVRDWRLEWLEEDFLLFLRQWENQSMARVQLSKEQRNRLCLSRETLEGLRITVKSFTSLVRELLLTEGVNYVLSGKLNQDPLEIYFSKQRSCGGNNDNPTVLDFNRNAQNIFVAGARAVRGAATGNCTLSDHDGMPVCGAPLPRRKRPR